MTINYLRGKAIDLLKTSNNRLMLILEVNQIGYEIQVPSGLARRISTDSPDNIQIFTHLQVREEQPFLYGFESATERDLFRQLLGVNGVGAQLALALLDTLGSEELVRAIVTGNIKALSKTSGVGTKTAERIALELRAKLAQWRQVVGVSAVTSAMLPSKEILEDLEMTLLALGYSSEEIDRAITALCQDELFRENLQVEDWIRNAISWLG